MSCLRVLAAVAATMSCFEDEFTCDDGLCVFLQQRCDGVKHCADNSDETHCPKGESEVTRVTRHRPSDNNSTFETEISNQRDNMVAHIKPALSYFYLIHIQHVSMRIFKLLRQVDSPVFWLLIYYC